MLSGVFLCTCTGDYHPAESSSGYYWKFVGAAAPDMLCSRYTSPWIWPTRGRFVKWTGRCCPFPLRDHQSNALEMGCETTCISLSHDSEPYSGLPPHPLVSWMLVLLFLQTTIYLSPGHGFPLAMGLAYTWEICEVDWALLPFSTKGSPI